MNLFRDPYGGVPPDFASMTEEEQAKARRKLIREHPAVVDQYFTEKSKSTISG